jgi:glutamate-1-semialdehyde 2,1-aminomutase
MSKNKILNKNIFWKRAKKVIPGGNMLFSKRPEVLLPENWPSYFSKSKGVQVWDLNNNKFIDMIFLVGTNTLGYANKEIDSHVKKVIDKGIMTSLNCPEEVLLAEKLIKIHPWADMVRFCRSGGEANSVAIRIARAASGKENVAVCGYHGWHDWYLAANLKSKKNLDKHLLTGLKFDGVPKNLEGTIFPFEYNNFDQLEKIVNQKNIGIIKMEVERQIKPVNNFLQKVRNLANKKKIVLIFDECTSGFRQTFGGLHKYYGVYPDMAMFGKAIGNGYAITAVIGKREIMEAAQNTFISSTFWTERIGPSAALKTLEIMEKIKSWKILPLIGEKIVKKWKEISLSNGIKITISGIITIPSFNFEGENSLIYKTYFTQEMLKKGFLAGNIIFVSTAHNEKILQKYFNAFEYVFSKINKINKQNKRIEKFLEGPVCHSTFRRLN